MEKMLRVLVVDDSLAICQVLREYLLYYEIHHVDYCHEGEQALAMVADASTAYDALFIDLHMDGMDGLELIHRLHQQRFQGGIIIVSALDARIVDYTLQVISNYSLRMLGSIEKPINRGLVAFMVRRIKHASGQHPNFEALPKRREIIEALRQDYLEVHFQPIINSLSNRVHSLEALSRIRPLNGELIAPNLFIPVIDKFELYSLFMEKLMAQVASDFRAIERETQIDCHLALNLSPKQLSNADLPAQMMDLCEKYAIDPHRLYLEITENHAIASEVQQKNLSRLSIHGFKLALDDYGSGYTNLRQITNMPFSEIKLDQELINGMHKDKVLKIIIESVCKITAELNLELVAEGVANPHDLISLDEFGVHLFQGFFFSRARARSEFIQWYRSWQCAIIESKRADERFMRSRRSPQ